MRSPRSWSRCRRGAGAGAGVLARRYDIVEGEAQVVDHPDMLVLEGLPFPEDHVDFTVYVDAEERDIEHWFLERFRALLTDARTDDASYFRPLADLSDDAATEFGRRSGSRSTT